MASIDFHLSTLNFRTVCSTTKAISIMAKNIFKKIYQRLSVETLYVSCLEMTLVGVIGLDGCLTSLSPFLSDFLEGIC